MIDGGGKRMQRLKAFFWEMYDAARYRKWVVYDPTDSTVIYIGKRKDCYRVMEESYGGLVVTPFWLD